MQKKPKKTQKKKKVIKLPPVKRTPKEQAQRNIQGTRIERLVANDLYKKFPRRSFRINKKAGIDIFLKNGKVIKIEVKGVKQREKTYKIRTIEGKKIKEETTREGRFTIKERDYLDSDLFAFVVKKISPLTLDWTGRTEPIRYIETSTIVRYLKSIGRYRTYKQYKLSISNMKKLPQVDIKKYVQVHSRTRRKSSAKKKTIPKYL